MSGQNGKAVVLAVVGVTALMGLSVTLLPMMQSEQWMDRQADADAQRERLNLHRVADDKRHLPQW
eukprot:CAMPEP_0177646594 /NCGR_PEP_ID=MMETSP0447-20121125/9853_1 /TAXON_ID=0 /ORGANISM="Stygamoeba regulata, Strain BSH-02190019" /LENGTH=64 /DNA_ID=CAMNT_0019149129 /DNA_START=132 /DNA_END=323 /DNA_ORIENTATION=-